MIGHARLKHLTWLMDLLIKNKNYESKFKESKGLRRPKEDKV